MPVRTSKRWTAALLLGLLIATPAGAWDATGHEVIARIAWERMTPRARRAALALLSQAPDDSGLLDLRARQGASADGDWLYFAAAATWPDVVRDTTKRRRFEKYAHGGWHYIDHYFRATPRGPVDLAEPAPDPVNAVSELERLSAELGDESVSASRRAVDLAWILHLVGDIHQPLHAVSRVTPALPEGDRGGNLFRLADRHNLHGYWDSGISRAYPTQPGELQAHRLERAARGITARVTPADVAGELEPGDFAAWANESYGIAKTIYDTPPGREPGAAYREAAFATAERRAALAGYRLADLLNRVLGGAGAAGGASSQGEAFAAPARAIRREIPMTDMIRRAFAAGTRDSTGRPGPRYWQLRTEYAIEARLEPATRTLTGREDVVIHNESDSTLSQIVLRLDQNVFRANVARAEKVTEITGGLELKRLVLNGQAVDLTDTVPPYVGRGGRRFGTPIASAITETSARIPLPTPIAAHGTGRMQAEWSFQVPRAFNERGLRMGAWADTLFQVAQWYPRVAVYDDLRGWDTDPYLGTAEFYNDFGRFDVKIDVPAGWLVGATGVLQNPEEVLSPGVRERLSHALESDEQRSIVAPEGRGAERATAAGGRLVWHFVADSVADVAWAASDRFVWDATRAPIPGRGFVPVDILYLPGHAQRYASAGAVVRHALGFYSKLWMPYAFPKMTVVDGPEGGMEYPMFIMSSTGAADHETGHQWWPMMVGTNETWYGFMDEGFNQYMNILSAVDRRGEAPPLDAGGDIPSLDGRGQAYGRTSGDEREAPLMWDGNYAGPLYAFKAYGKAPMMLSMLGGIVGDTAVLRAMSDYARAWRFKHPSPWDYAFFMSRALHRDLGWFWYSWLFTTDAVDGSIQRVASAGGRTTVTVRQDGQMPAPIVLRVELAPTGPAIRPMPNSTMIDATTAEVRWPVDVWFGGRRTYDAVLDFGGRAVEKVTLDPHGRFPDADPDDNVWPRLTPRSAGSARSP